MATSPTIRKRKLGGELRKIRQAAGVSVEHMAERLGCSLSRVSHIENGRNAPRKTDLEVLMNLYDSPKDVREALEDLRKASGERGWWATYRLPLWLSTYVGMESDATAIRVFELELVTALLQTNAYARRTQEMSPKFTPEDVDRLTDARMRRQAILDGPHAPKLTVILSESVLARTGHDSVGAEQLRHLIQVSKKPNVTIQVLPWSAGLHRGMNGALHLLDFDPDVSLPVAYQDFFGGGHLIDDPAVVDELGGVFETLAAGVLSKRESLARIERYAVEAEDHA